MIVRDNDAPTKLVQMGGHLHWPRALFVEARFRFPQLFPLLSTKRVLVGHVGKFGKAAFYKISHSADPYPHVIPKSDEERCHKLDRPAIVHGDRIHSWDDDGTHCVSLNSVGLDTYGSVAFTGGS
jgi:hypothetical protein